MWRAALTSVLTLAAVIAAPLALGAQSSSGGGRVGGPPFVRPAVDEGKATTAPIVIARGTTYDGPLELVALGWEPTAGELVERPQFCVWIEYPPSTFPSFGSCRGARELPAGRGIQIEDKAVLPRPKRLRYTEIGGVLTPNVASVRVAFRREGDAKTHRDRATVARVSGRLQEQLEQPAPFGYFAAKLRGPVRFKEIRVTALDEEGRVVGSAGHLARR